jgi:ankyrin repeat protein
LFVALSLLLPLPPRSVRAGDEGEARPLIPVLVAAIRDGDVNAVRKLLDNGAGVNARDADGNTPLILA